MRYLYTLRVAFEAADDVAARELLARKPGDIAYSRAALMLALAASPVVGANTTTEKLQRLNGDRPPRTLMDWTPDQ